MSEENNEIKKKRGRPKKNTSENNKENNKEKTDIVSLSSPEKANDIVRKISEGKEIELDLDKQVLLNNFNTFMLAEAYTQLPTIIKLHELQTKCLDKYYEQVNEMLDEGDYNVFLLEKIINAINTSIDRCNNIILKLGLNSDITDSLMITHVDNSQNINVYQSQISKQRVLNTIDKLLANPNLLNADSEDNFIDDIDED